MNSTTQTLTTVRRTALNPNAQEFVPTALRSSSSFTTVATADETSECVKASLDRKDSCTSCDSDEECQKYWHSQLPDDIFTPDFDFLGQACEEKSELEHCVSRASSFDSFDLYSNHIKLTDSVTENLPSEGLAYSKRHQQIVPQSTALGLSDSNFGAASQNADYFFEVSTRAVHGRQLWEHHDASSLSQTQSFGKWDGHLPSNGSGLNSLNEGLTTRDEVDLVNLLTNEFQGFEAQIVADIYQANGGDLSLTIETLTQLELHENGNSWRCVSSQPSFYPNLKLLDFPALSPRELVSGLPQVLEDVDVQQPAGSPSALRKNAFQWQCGRNGAAKLPLGSSGFQSQNLGFSSFGGDSQVLNEERIKHLPHAGQISLHSPRSWLETEDAVASIYSELREEARDHALVRNAYFEQARQAYFIGDKALAKEASAKGQLHNRLMKAARSKAGETILQQRNIATAQVSSFGLGQPWLLDLHDLHVNEAITLLKQELSALRVAARSSRQRQQVFICVGGPGHQTKGFRTPARLPWTVKQYLAEDEHLHFTEPQPGMIKVVPCSQDLQGQAVLKYLISQKSV